MATTTGACALAALRRGQGGTPTRSPLALAREFAGTPVRSVGVAPSAIDTDFQKRHSSAERLDKIVAQTPSGRIGTADEVAWTIALLASPRSAYINGAILPVTEAGNSSGNEMMSTEQTPSAEPQFFFLMPVWGKAYVDYLLTFALPTLLAPNNLPWLPNRAGSQFRFLTTEEDETRIRASHLFGILDALAWSNSSISRSTRDHDRENSTSSATRCSSAPTRRSARVTASSFTQPVSIPTGC